MLVELGLDGDDSLLRVLVLAVELEHLRVGDERFVGLPALLVEHAQVVPDLAHLRVERGGLDDVLEGVRVVARVVVEDGERGPVDGLARVLVGGLLEVLERVLGVLEAHVAAAQHVERVRLPLVLLLRLLHVLDRRVDVPLQEVRPRQVLVDLEVVLVVVQRRLVRTLRLRVVLRLLVQQPDLQQRVHLPLHRERVRQNRVLEIRYRLLDLIRLRKDYTKFVEDFAFLVEVR